MPTYEYRCEKGHTFERFQRMTEPPLDACVECGAPAQRLLSPGAGIHFKGSGFYITDNRSESYKKDAQADAPPKPPAPKSDSGSPKPESGSPKPAGGDG
jgi:putative FmdB family regulatory protein